MIIAEREAVEEGCKPYKTEQVETDRCFRVKEKND